MPRRRTLHNTTQATPEMVHGVRYKTINVAALATGIGRRTLQVRKRVALNHVRLFVNARVRMRS